MVRHVVIDPVVAIWAGIFLVGIMCAVLVWQQQRIYNHVMNLEYRMQDSQNDRVEIHKELSTVGP